MQRLTDCANTETMFRIIQSISSPKVEPLKRGLARRGSMSSKIQNRQWHGYRNGNIWPCQNAAPVFSNALPAS